MKNTVIDFDENRIILAAHRASINALKNAGAYVRRVARNLVKVAPDPVGGNPHSSPPGTPPNTHPRSGKQLKRSLLFGIEKQRLSVVVGPAYTFVGISMSAHEYGGNYRGRNYPRRPLMRPALNKSIGKISTFWRDAVK